MLIKTTGHSETFTSANTAQTSKFVIMKTKNAFVSKHCFVYKMHSYMILKDHLIIFPNNH